MHPRECDRRDPAATGEVLVLSHRLLTSSAGAHDARAEPRCSGSSIRTWSVLGYSCYVPLVTRTTSEILGMLEANGDAIRRYGVRSLGLFGSAARGTARPESDLDFVVEFDRKSFDAYMDLKLFLEQIFGCRVDLVLAGAIKPRLRSAILGEAIHAAGL